MADHCAACHEPVVDDRPFCPGSDKPAAPGAGTRYGYCAVCHEPFVLSDGEVPGHRSPDPRVAELIALATTDPAGEDTGHLRCPGSRYGRTADDVAPWAVAAALIFESANGDDAADVLDEMMGYAVNDSDSIVELVADHWYAVPQALRDLLEGSDALTEHLASLEPDDDDEAESDGEIDGQLVMTMDGF